jgi:hypothetical protein
VVGGGCPASRISLKTTGLLNRNVESPSTTLYFYSARGPMSGLISYLGVVCSIRELKYFFKLKFLLQKFQG